MINNTGELQHHGIPGMKWGIRRYQNKDGSLTPAGRKRAEKLKKQYKELTGKKLVGKALSKKADVKIKEDPNKKKSISEMTDAELKEQTNRMRLENDYNDAKSRQETISKKKVSTGRKIVNHIRDNVLAPAATEAGKRVLTDWLTKTGKDALDLNTKSSKPNAELRQEVEKLELEKKKITYTEQLENLKKKNKK